jgi:hypothetical protein
MNPSHRNPFTPDSVSVFTPGSVEATLRLIATLPAPAGLEDRVQAKLLSAPQTARVLAWPVAFKPQAGWLRAAAAAAIVFVVAGGGWSVYSRVQPGLQSGARAVPVHVASPSAGFSSAGAMRTPQTLNGPVVPAPAAADQPVGAVIQAPAKPGQTAANRGKTAAKEKASAPPASTQSK